MARRFFEVRARSGQSCVVAGEVVGVQEEADPAAVLVADHGCLHRRRRLGKQQAEARVARRRHPHPALAAAAVGVFQQFETQRIAIPGDRLVVVAHDQRDHRDMGCKRG